MINIIIINLASEQAKRRRALERISALNLEQLGIRAHIWIMQAITPATQPAHFLPQIPPQNLQNFSQPPGGQRAVRGKKSSSAQKSANEQKTASAQINAQIKFKKRFLSPVEIACASSHILAQKAAAMGGASRIFTAQFARCVKNLLIFYPALPARISLILEDDVKFSPKFAQILAQIATQPRSELISDALICGHHLQLYADDGYLIATPLKRRSRREFAGYFWAEHAGMSVGAYAYIIGVCGARKLVNSSLPIARPADWSTHNNPAIFALFAAPALAGCEHEASSTKSDFSRRKRSKISKIFKNVKFYVKFFIPKYFG